MRNRRHLPKRACRWKGVLCLPLCCAAGWLGMVFAMPAQNLFLDGPSTRHSRDASRHGGSVGEAGKNADAQSGKGEVATLEGAARNPSLGKIIWVDPTGRRGVVWLDPEALHLVHLRATPHAAPQKPQEKANRAEVRAAPKNAAAPTTTAANTPPTPPSTPPKPATTTPTPASPAVNARPLLATRDARLAPEALVRIARLNPGELGIGVVAMRGTLYEGAEVFLPSPEMLATLERALPENIAKTALVPASALAPSTASAPASASVSAPIPAPASAISAPTPVSQGSPVPPSAPENPVPPPLPAQ